MGRCPDKVLPQWAPEGNYCLRVETWPDNLSAAGSGLSKTTVSFPACAHTKTLAHMPHAHTFVLAIPLSSSLLFADSAFYNNSLCVCASAPSFSSFSVACVTPPSISLHLHFFPTTLAFILQAIHLSVAALASACSKFQG